MARYTTMQYDAVYNVEVLFKLSQVDNLTSLVNVKHQNDFGFRKIIFIHHGSVKYYEIVFR